MYVAINLLFADLIAIFSLLQKKSLILNNDKIKLLINLLYKIRRKICVKYGLLLIADKIYKTNTKTTKSQRDHIVYFQEKKKHFEHIF